MEVQKMFKASRKQMIVVVSAVGIYLTGSMGYMVYAMPKSQESAVAKVAIEEKAKGTEKALEATHKALDEVNKQAETKTQEAAEATKTVKDLAVQNITLQSELEMVKQEKEKLAQEKEQLAKDKQQLAEQSQGLAEENKSLTSKMQKMSYTKKSGRVSILSADSNGPVYDGTPISNAGDTIKVKATAYTAECEGCSGITYTGIDVRTETPKIIAVDPTVIPLKATVELFIGGKSWGLYRTEDIGSAIKGNKIDILYSNEPDANRFGIQNAEVKIVNRPFMS
jgi:3D (Asp-Asp-Asp) domain-containing protein